MWGFNRPWRVARGCLLRSFAFSRAEPRIPPPFKTHTCVLIRAAPKNERESIVKDAATTSPIIAIDSDVISLLASISTVGFSDGQFEIRIKSTVAPAGNAAPVGVCDASRRDRHALGYPWGPDRSPLIPAEERDAASRGMAPEARPRASSRSNVVNLIV